MPLKDPLKGQVTWANQMGLDLLNLINKLVSHVMFLFFSNIANYILPKVIDMGNIVTALVQLPVFKKELLLIFLGHGKIYWRHSDY